MKKTFHLFFSIITSLSAVAQTAEEIVRKSEDQLKGKSSHGRFAMTVITPQYTRTMEMENWWVGTERALIVIKAPKKEAGNKWLKIGNEMWTYLRNTETTIKIPPSMLLQSWNGSDFTNDDLARESSMIEDYNQKVVAEELLRTEKCWKIELTPKPDAPVVWGKIYYWVRQKDYLPSAIDYYDEKGTLRRRMVYSDFKVIGGRKIPTKWTMENRTKEGRRTEFSILDIKFNKKISDRIFSFQELERGN